MGAAIGGGFGVGVNIGIGIGMVGMCGLVDGWGIGEIISLSAKE